MIKTGQKLSIKALQKEIGRLKTLVHHDPVPGLYNRFGFTEDVEGYLKELKCEYQKKSKNRRNLKIGNLSIVFADLNDFKKLNDKYGHVCGDEAIKTFGKLLKMGVRSIDVVCRWSGDEFVFALVGADIKEAQKAVEKIRKMVVERVWKICGKFNSSTTFNRGDKVSQKISASFGVASVIDGTRKPKQVFELKTLLHEADKKMYQDKKRQKLLSGLKIL